MSQTLKKATYSFKKADLEKIATDDGWDAFEKRIQAQEDYSDPADAIHDAALVVCAYFGGRDKYKDLPSNGNADAESTHILLDTIICKALPHAGSKELAELWAQTGKWYA
jgi:hypothetical protein